MLTSKTFDASALYDYIPFSCTTITLLVVQLYPHWSYNNTPFSCTTRDPLIVQLDFSFHFIHQKKEHEKDTTRQNQYERYQQDMHHDTRQGERPPEGRALPTHLR